MISQKVLSLLLLSVFVCSFFGFSVGATPSGATAPLFMIAEGSQQAPPVASPEEPHRIVPVSLLVYTQYVDSAPGAEWENTMTAINDTYGTDYYYTNLTDYTQLDTELAGHDILLIPEQEKVNQVTTKMIGTAWASTLTTFVNEGGIVILMDYGNYTLDPANGSTTHIYNESGLMQINGVTQVTSSTIYRVNDSDALARGVAASWTAPSGSLSFDTPENTSVVDDGTDPVVVHKIMGKGHVVLIGHDFYNRESNCDQVLANAIRLHRHVVFDASHNPYGTIFSGYSAWADDLVTDNFAVSSMGQFDPAFFSASDVLVIISTGATNYTTGELTAIQAFVEMGGGLFIVQDWGSWADELEPIANLFGFNSSNTFDAADDRYLTDTDDFTGDQAAVTYAGANIRNHSLTLGVTQVENYYGNGFTDLPAEAKSIIVTDTDGTSDWDDGSPADGVTAMAASTFADGRVVVSLDFNWLRDDQDLDGDLSNDYFDQAGHAVLAVNTIRWLSAAGLKERIVLFDNSHTPISSYNVNNHYLELGNYLTSNGYTVHWMSTFYTTLLDEAHVLVVVESNSAYTNAEIAAIVAFVAAGGGLFLMADWGGFGVNVDVIGNEFGIDRNDTSYLDDSDDWLVGTSYIIYEESNMGNHPIMEGISRIEVDRGTAFDTVGSGTVLMASDNDDTCTWNNGGIANNIAVFAATEHELGRVVYITDMNFFSGFDDPDVDGVPDFYEADNNLFAVNAFQWLAENQAPVVEVTAPNGGEEFSGTTSITWTATDPNKDEFTVDISYSINGGSSWSVLTTGLTTMSWSWDTSTTPDSDQYLIRVEATDYELTGQDVSDAVFLVDNNGPTISNVVLSPSGPTSADMANVSAEVTDISGVKSVALYYTVNSGSLQSVAMSKVSGDTYAGVFPTAFAVSDEVEYYVKAIDNNDFESMSSSAKFTVAAPPGIPGFELPVVTLGLLASLGILFIVRRKRR
ncbi:MAG: Ig-like domain-containing protein [Promethearchaeota archaeon]